MVSSVRFDRLAERYAARSERFYPDSVTFRGPTVTADSVGGQTSVVGDLDPIDIPVRYRPASGDESLLAGKQIAKASYMLFIPAVYDSELINVNSKSKAMIAARTNGEPSRTLQVHWIGRYEGVEIQLLASLED
jgi:hypothetical protein